MKTIIARCSEVGGTRLTQGNDQMYVYCKLSTPLSRSNEEAVKRRNPIKIVRVQEGLQTVGYVGQPLFDFPELLVFKVIEFFDVDKDFDPTKEEEEECFNDC